MRIIETDNYGGDYPNESFVNIPDMPKEQCEVIAKVINDFTGEHHSRYYRVVENDYKLQPGFEP